MIFSVQTLQAPNPHLIPPLLSQGSESMSTQFIIMSFIIGNEQEEEDNEEEDEEAEEEVDDDDEEEEEDEEEQAEENNLKKMEEQRSQGKVCLFLFSLFFMVGPYLHIFVLFSLCKLK